MAIIDRDFRDAGDRTDPAGRKEEIEAEHDASPLADDKKTKVKHRNRCCAPDYHLSDGSASSARRVRWRRPPMPKQLTLVNWSRQSGKTRSAMKPSRRSSPRWNALEERKGLSSAHSNISRLLITSLSCPATLRAVSESAAMKPRNVPNPDSLPMH